MSFTGFVAKVSPVEPIPVPMPRHSAFYRDPDGTSGARRAALARQVRHLWGAGVQAHLFTHATEGGAQIVARLDWYSPWGTVLLDSVAEDAIATCTMLLTVYEDDRTTVAWQVSSDPFHANPYLILPQNYAEQEIDVIGGAVSIGQVEVGAIDRRQTAGDQASGWLTERLSVGGIGAIHGRRCRLTMPVDSEGNSIVIADGPAGPPRLDSSYSAYRWTIRDTRDTERKLRAFTGNTASPYALVFLRDGEGDLEGFVVFSDSGPSDYFFVQETEIASALEGFWHLTTDPGDEITATPQVVGGFIRI